MEPARGDVRLAARQLVRQTLTRERLPHLFDVFLSIASLLVGWGVARHYYKRQAVELPAELRRQSIDDDRKDTAAYFETLLELSDWTHERIDDKDTWVCDRRATFKIVALGNFREFNEEWTRKVPDTEHNSMSTVELRINDSPVRALSFVSLDGGRYLVPLPRPLSLDRKPIYCWERSSLGFKVCRIVGRYYRGNGLEDTARFLGIEIVP